MIVRNEKWGNGTQADLLTKIIRDCRKHGSPIDDADTPCQKNVKKIIYEREKPLAKANVFVVHFNPFFEIKGFANRCR